MSAWWSNMAPRERMLIGIAGLLTVIVILWQFILVPALGARAEARENLAASDQVLSRIQENFVAKRALGSASVSANATAMSLEDFKASITGSAADIGLAITRLQGNDETSIRLVFEQADPRLIFLWLEDVQTKLSGEVTRFSMEQAGGGLVRVWASF